MNLLWGLSIKYALREASNNKVHYVIGTVSVFLVVCVVSVLLTVLKYSPIVFLSLAENDGGEIDLLLTARFGSGFDRINYTKIKSYSESLDLISVPRYSLAVDAFRAIECQGFRDDQPLLTTFTYTNCKEPIQPCIYSICSSSVTTTLLIIQSDAEKRAGIGRSWPFPSIPKHAVYVHSSIARSLGVSAGDWIFITLDIREAFPSSFAYATNWSFSKNTPTYINVPLNVNVVFDVPYGKYSTSSDNVVILEWNGILSEIATSLPAVFDRDVEYRYQSPTASLLLDDSVTDIIVACSGSRVYCYMSSDFTSTAMKITNWASSIVYDIGFPELSISLSVLNKLNSYQFFSAFIQLLFSIVSILLVVLCIFLIYSLLLVAIEAKTFELGIFRMVGMTKGNIVTLIAVQAMSYSVTGWICGMLGAQVAWTFLKGSLENLIKLQIYSWIDVEAAIYATLLGIFAPLLASFFPIRRALTWNLHDSMDQRHSKTQAFLVTVERSNPHSLSMKLFYPGVAMCTFGFLVYYFLPLALVLNNISLMFNIFFGLLVGMLAGLVVLSLNFLSCIEFLVVLLIFCCAFLEKDCVRLMVQKNIIAHRLRNRKTSITFAIALGFLVFMTTAIRTELDSMIYSKVNSFGSDVTIIAKSNLRDINGDLVGLENRYQFENYCENSGVIEWFSYSTYGLDAYKAGTDSTQISNLGRIRRFASSFYASSPNIFEFVGEEALGVERKFYESTFGGAMYSPTGSFSVYIGLTSSTLINNQLLGSLFQEKLNLQTSKDSFFLQYEENKIEFSALAFLEYAPIFDFSKYPSKIDQDLLTSITNFSPLLDENLKELSFQNMLIGFKKNSSMYQIQSAIADLSKIKTSETISILSDQLASLESAQNTLAWIFRTASIIVMAIAFFSLNSSMYANITEQVKEIGVLRSLGLTRFQLLRTFIYEAFVVVFSSSLLGILIGLGVGWTMTLQRSVLLGVPLELGLPWDIILIVLSVSLVSSILSTIVPIHQLVYRRSIVNNIR